jgi:hypothetical protein
MKLVKNPLTINDDAWEWESLTEIAESLVCQRWVLSVQAVRFMEPAPDQIFYVVLLQATDHEILLISDFEEQDYRPVCDRACFATLHDALACMRDSIYSLSCDLKL